MTCPLVVLAAALVFTGPVAAQGKKPRVDIQRVWIAAGEAGGRVSSHEVRAKKSSKVQLYLVVEAKVDGKRRVFSRASKLYKGRRRVRNVQQWPATLGKLDVTWFKLEPDPLEAGIYDNTGTMEPYWHPKERGDHPDKWHWCTPEYLETDTRWGAVWSHRADAVPTTTTNYGGLGTMRFVARVKHGKETVWTPGKERMDNSGLKSGIATVRFRRDDTPVGYMTELLNVPYVYGSSSPSGRVRDHQTERAVGADCADLVIYGWRRARKKQKYTWTGGLKSRSKRRVWVTDLKNGQYRTGDGRSIRFGKQIKVGDMLLWDRHVAVIAKRDPSGYLTPDTQIIHTVVEAAALIPLKDIGFTFDSPPFDIRRAKWDRSK